MRVFISESWPLDVESKQQSKQVQRPVSDLTENHPATWTYQGQYLGFLTSKSVFLMPPLTHLIASLETKLKCL